MYVINIQPDRHPSLVLGDVAEPFDHGGDAVDVVHSRDVGDAVVVHYLDRDRAQLSAKLSFFLCYSKFSSC